MNHEWQLLAASGGSQDGFGPIVVAVCTKCGVIRAEEAPRGRGSEGQLDLTGECESRGQYASRR